MLERGLHAEDQGVASARAGRGSASPCACRCRESSAMGVSGSRARPTSSASILTSTPPSLTRSSCLSSPVTVRKRALREARDRRRRSRRWRRLAPLVGDGARAARAARRRTRRAARRTAPSSDRAPSRPSRRRTRARRAGAARSLMRVRSVTRPEFTGRAALVVSIRGRAAGASVPLATPVWEVCGERRPRLDAGARGPDPPRPSRRGAQPRRRALRAHRGLRLSASSATGWPRPRPRAAAGAGRPVTALYRQPAAAHAGVRGAVARGASASRSRPTSA